MHAKALLLGFDQRARQQRIAHAGGHAAEDGVQHAQLHDAYRRHTHGGHQQLDPLAVAAALAKGQKHGAAELCGGGEARQRLSADQHQLFTKYRPGLQLVLWCGTVDEGTVDATGRQLHQQCGAGLGVQLQVDTRMLPAQLGQQWWQTQCGRGFHRTYAQGALDLAGCKLPGLQHGQHLVMRLQHLPRRLQQRASGRSGKDRVGSHQQLHACFVLELFDMGRDIGLHGVQPLGSGTKAAAFADGFEHAQGFELHMRLQYLELRCKSSF